MAGGGGRNRRRSRGGRSSRRSRDPNPPLLVDQNVAAEIGGVENLVNLADASHQGNPAAIGDLGVVVADAPIGDDSPQQQERRVKARHDQQSPPGPPPPPPPQQEVQPPPPQQQIQPPPPPQQPQPPPPLPMPPRRQAAPTAPVYAHYPALVPPYRQPPQLFQPPQQPPPPFPLQSPPRLLHLLAYQRNPFIVYPPQNPFALFQPQSPLPLIPAGFIPYHSTLPPPHRPQIRSFLPYPFAPYLPQQTPRPNPLHPHLIHHNPRPRPVIEQIPGMPLLDVPLRLRAPGQHLYQLCRKQLSTSDLQGVLTVTGPNGDVLKDMAQQADIDLPIMVNVLILYGPVRRRSMDCLSSLPEGGLSLAWSLFPVFRFARNQWVNIWFELNPPTINIYILVDHP